MLNLLALLGFTVILVRILLAALCQINEEWRERHEPAEESD